MSLGGGFFFFLLSALLMATRFVHLLHTHSLHRWSRGGGFLTRGGARTKGEKKTAAPPSLFRQRGERGLRSFLTPPAAPPPAGPGPARPGRGPSTFPPGGRRTEMLCVSKCERERVKGPEPLPSTSPLPPSPPLPSSLPLSPLLTCPTSTSSLRFSRRTAAPTPVDASRPRSTNRRQARRRRASNWAAGDAAPSVRVGSRAAAACAGSSRRSRTTTLAQSRSRVWVPGGSGRLVGREEEGSSLTGTPGRARKRSI